MTINRFRKCLILARSAELTAGNYTCSLCGDSRPRLSGRAQPVFFPSRLVGFRN